MTERKEGEKKKNKKVRVGYSEEHARKLVQGRHAVLN